MRKFLFVVLGLALLGGAVFFAAGRFGYLPPGVGLPGTVAQRTTGASPGAVGQRRNDSGSNSLQTFEMAINVANVLVGILGIWMTMRGMRAERRSR